MRVFHVWPGVNFDLRNLTVASGSNQMGAAIFNDKGNTVATNVTFSGNIAEGLAGTGAPTTSMAGPSGAERRERRAAYACGAIYNTGTFRDWTTASWTITPRWEALAASGGNGGGNSGGTAEMEGTAAAAYGRKRFINSGTLIDLHHSVG